MAEDRGGKRKGVNGGRSGRVHWFGPFADREYRRQVFGADVERDQKSNKRRAIHCSSRGGLARWEDLSPMAQHEFRIDIALPRLAALERLGPWPGSCVEYAPVAWNELGPDFAIAFLKAHERKHSPRQTAIKSDIQCTPSVTATTRRMTRVPVAITWFACAVSCSIGMSKVLCLTLLTLLTRLFAPVYDVP